VDRGGPFGLLGYDCRWLKLEGVRQAGADFGSLFARAAPNDSEPHKFQLQRMQTHSVLSASLRARETTKEGLQAMEFTVLNVLFTRSSTITSY
jgi:hypothetical protein